MLIEFRVENHRSLRDEQVLTMEAGRVGDEDDPRPRKVPGHAKKLLTVAALYGANASGKSNVLSALAFMREAVLTSHWLWSPDQAIPRQPFAWGPKSTEASMFEVAILIGKTRYQYGFALTDEIVAEEWLNAWPKGKKQTWFERDGDDYKFSENLKGENQTIKSVTRNNALFLSTAAQHGHSQLAGVHSWFNDLDFVNLDFALRIPGRIPPYYSTPSRSMTRHAGTLRAAALGQSTPAANPILEAYIKLLKGADSGITGLKFVGNVSEDDRFGPIDRNIRLRHQAQIDDAWLPLKEESRGTRRVFEIARPILVAVQEGGLLLVDELEASLHPLLAQRLVQLFNDPKTNPKNAQLIFTTHDTNLLSSTLGEPALRRDQIWLTEKDQEGATVLYPMTDYKPRKAESLERGYLLGRYGAIPFLGGLAAYKL